MRPALKSFVVVFVIVFFVSGIVLAQPIENEDNLVELEQSTEESDELFIDGEITQWYESVPKDKIWTVRFNYEVDVTTLAYPNIKVEDSEGNTTPVNVIPSGDLMTIEIAPLVPYMSGEQYTLYISDQIKTSDGKLLNKSRVIRFNVSGYNKLVDISISPQNVTAQSGEIVEFSAIVTGTDNQDVIWEMKKGKEGGVISSDGIYIAPEKAGTYNIIAKSKENPEKVALATVNVIMPQVKKVDFFLSYIMVNENNESLKLGQKMTIRARVDNKSLEDTNPGGSVVRFLVDGKTIDEVPINFSKGDYFKDVVTHYYLLEGPYIDLPQKDETSVKIEAVIDPEDKRVEKDEENNRSELWLNVVSDMDTNYTGDSNLYLDSTNISAYTVINDINSTAGVAYPGQPLTVLADLQFDEDYATPKSGNVKFYIDNQLIKVKTYDNYTFLYEHGLQPFARFFVPNNYDKDKINCRVVLDNGCEGTVDIPVMHWDFAVTEAGMNWTNSIIAIPGEKLFLKARIFNNTGTQKPRKQDGECIIVVVNGEIIDQKFWKADENNESIIQAYYDVPVLQTEPLKFSIIIDPYNQSIEKDKKNNIATIEIPIYQDKKEDPSIYISRNTKGYFNGPIIPGKTIYLMSGIINNSWELFSDSNLKMKYKINGEIVDEFEINSNNILAGQQNLFVRPWTVPKNLNKDIVFDVVLNSYEVSDDTSTEKILSYASFMLPVERPEINVYEEELSFNSQKVYSGEKIILNAIVHNDSMVPVAECPVAFMINNQEVARELVTVSANTSISVEKEYEVPLIESVEPDTSLINDESTNLSYQVFIDPENTISKSRAGKDKTGEVIIPVYQVPEDRTISVSVKDGMTGVKDTEVVLLLDSENMMEGKTNSEGICAFTGATAGIHELFISKPGYKTISKKIEIKQNEYSKDFTINKFYKKDYSSILGTDLDRDYMPDSSEETHKSSVTDEDTDKDGVPDGVDISPLINPVNPNWIEKQKPGMINFKTPIKAYGMEGTAESYFRNPVTKALVLSEMYKDEGVLNSILGEGNIAGSINKIFEEIGFSVRDIGEIDLQKEGIVDEEIVEYNMLGNSFIIPSSSLHPVEYRFYYDYITKYNTANVKNSEELSFPLNSEHYRYLWYPINIKNGYEQCLTMQFRDSITFDKISYQDDQHYNIPALMYSLYKSDDFENEINTPYYENTAVIMIQDKDILSVVLDIPKEIAIYEDSYIKITPVWISKHDTQSETKPLNPNFDFKGITKSIVYKNETYESISLTQEYKSFRDLNDRIIEPEELELFSGELGYEKEEIEYSVLSYNPYNISDKYLFSEVKKNIVSYTISESEELSSVINSNKSIVFNIEKFNNLESYEGTIFSNDIFNNERYDEIFSDIEGLSEPFCVGFSEDEAWIVKNENKDINADYFSQYVFGNKEILVLEYSGKVGELNSGIKLPDIFSGKGQDIFGELIFITENDFYMSNADKTEDIFLKRTYEKFIKKGLYKGIWSVVLSQNNIDPLSIISSADDILVESEVFNQECKKLLFNQAENYYNSSRYTDFEYFILGEIPYNVSENAYISLRNNLFKVINHNNDTGLPYISIFVEPEI